MRLTPQEVGGIGLAPPRWVLLVLVLRMLLAPLTRPFFGFFLAAIAEGALRDSVFFVEREERGTSSSCADRPLLVGLSIFLLLLFFWCASSLFFTFSPFWVPFGSSFPFPSLVRFAFPCGASGRSTWGWGGGGDAEATPEEEDEEEKRGEPSAGGRKDGEEVIRSGEDGGGGMPLPCTGDAAGRVFLFSSPCGGSSSSTSSSSSSSSTSSSSFPETCTRCRMNFGVVLPPPSVMGCVGAGRNGERAAERDGAEGRYPCMPPPERVVVLVILPLDGTDDIADISRPREGVGGRRRGPPSWGVWSRSVVCRAEYISSPSPGPRGGEGKGSDEEAADEEEAAGNGMAVGFLSRRSRLERTPVLLPSLLSVLPARRWRCSRPFPPISGMECTGR